MIGNPADITIERVLDGGFLTLDGRIRDKGLFTPGGDAGEFVLAL